MTVLAPFAVILLLVVAASRVPWFERHPVALALWLLLLLLVGTGAMLWTASA